MLYDSSKRKNIRGIINRYLFRISRTGKHLNRFKRVQATIKNLAKGYCIP